MTRVWILVVLISATLVNARWDIAVGVQHTVELVSLDGASGEVGGELVGDVSLGNGVAAALGYDSIKNQIYYQDSIHRKIFRVNVTGNNFRRQPIITYQGVSDIAVDPISSTLYWTTGNSIRRANVSEDIIAPSDGENLISFDRDELAHGIAVDVCNRHLYWTNKYDGRPSIERSDLDGNNRKVIVDKVVRPIGLFVDQATSRIYWTDEQPTANDHRVESVDFNGQNRILHAKLKYLPLSLVVVQNKIYWLDSYDSKAVRSIDIVLNGSSSSMAQNSSQVIRFSKSPIGIITSQQDSSLASKECKAIADKRKEENLRCILQMVS